MTVLRDDCKLEQVTKYFTVVIQLLMPGTLIYGANQLKEQNKLYVSGSYELLEGKKKIKDDFYSKLP